MNLKLSIVKYQLSIFVAITLFFALPLKAQVTIGAQKAPHSYSVLELMGTKGGFRLPMLNTGERDALKLTPDSTEAGGLVIYNTDIDCVEFWSNGNWVDLCSATPAGSIVNNITLTSAAGTDAQTVCSGAAITPVTYATTNATGATVIGLPAGVTGSWNTDAVTISGAPAASGNYTYIVALTGGSGSGMAIGTITVNTAPKLTISGNNGVVKNATTTYSVTPIPDVTNYTWTVSGTDWSIVSGQGSNSITVTCGADNGTITVSAINSCGAGTASMDVKVGCPVKTTSGNWLTFMCYNLGAAAAVQSLTPAQQATYTNSYAVYGDYYQWGRQADGHQLSSSQGYPTDNISSESGVVSSPNLDDNGQVVSTFDAYGKFIKSDVTPYDWRYPTCDTLWYTTSGIKTVNEPCPDGWRIPTMADWQSIFASLSGNTWKWNTGVHGFLITPLGSSEPTLFLPAAGVHSSVDGSFSGISANGYYWSSSVTNPYSFYMAFTLSGAYQAISYRAGGLSIRCVAE